MHFVHKETRPGSPFLSEKPSFVIEFTEHPKGASVIFPGASRTPTESKNIIEVIAQTDRREIYPVQKDR